MTASTVQPIFKKMIVVHDLQYRLAITAKGRFVGVREVRADDAALIAEFFGRLSQHTQQLRFFRPYLYQEQIWKDAKNFAHPYSNDKFSMLATICEDGEEHAIGLVQLFRLPDN